MDEDDLGIAALFNQINELDIKEKQDEDWGLFSLINDFDDISPIECWSEFEQETMRWLAEDPYEQLQVEDEEMNFLLTMIETFEQQENDIEDILEVSVAMKQPVVSDGCWEYREEAQDEDRTTEITTPSSSFVSESPLYVYYSPVPDVLLYSVESCGL